MGRDSRIKCAVVGYGRNFNFGRMHARWISACDSLELSAICDIDPVSRENAAREFPGVHVFDSVRRMLSESDAGLVCVITPHNTHAAIAIECLKAGKHVLVDKAMATSVQECTLMLEEARHCRRSLSVFHNRRHDGNYRAIKTLVDNGALGDVFHVECSEERYAHPRHWWYTSRKASGGAFFFWGPHAVDWALNLIPSKVVSVTGFAKKRLWHDVDIQDEVRAMLRFENGATAAINFSSISLTRRPLWRILGTKGAIEDLGEGPIPGATIPGYGEEISVPSCGSFRLVRLEGGKTITSGVPYETSDWLSYYADLAGHLLHGKPSPVSGEEGRRVVAVLEAAERSGLSGTVELIAPGFYQSPP